MGNFMSCVLICGAMEVVQVVNTNGRVEKLIRPVRAAEIIWAHERYNAAAAATGLPPDEKQPQSRPSSSGKKEEKFVLVPLSDDEGRKPGTGGDSAGSRTRGKSSFSDAPAAATAASAPQQGHSQPFKVKKEGGVTTLIVSKRYLEQLLAEKSPATVDTKPNEVATPKCPRRPSSSSAAKRPSIWRPALESISESTSGSTSSGSGSGHSQSKQQQHHQHRRHRQQQGLVKF